VTGASGYLGSHIVKRLCAERQRVRSLVRSPQPDDDSAFEFSLGHKVSPQALRGVDILVHCAYEFGSGKEEVSHNIKGTSSLLRAAHAAKVRRVIIISSMAAYEGCPSVYGRTKRAIERVAHRYEGAIVIRPGLIYGGNSGHIVAKIERMLRRTRLIPIVGGSKKLYLVHVDDVARLVAALGDTDTPPQTITFASPTPIQFSELVRQLAPRPIMLIPLPDSLIFWGLRSLEAFGVRPPIASDSMIGLLHADRFPDFAAMREIGVIPRPFSKPKTSHKRSRPAAKPGAKKAQRIVKREQ
jgi:nucleoside-diphosphate-sugar epimerase